MRALSFLHRWAGGLIGLLLALLGLSGAILAWEGQWVRVAGGADPFVEDVGRIAAISDAAAGRGDLSRITFASDEIGLHLLTYADGSGAYVTQDGAIADSWATQWERPELWLFDLHHHLFAGHSGEVVTGIAGIAGLLFVVTGCILWWRSRRSFAPRMWPRKLAPGPVVSHHRDLGLIAAPLLLVSMSTGVMMLFEPIRTALLGEEERPLTTLAAVAPHEPGAALRTAKRLFPDADLRRLTLPSEPGKPISIRMRQPFEWTPNGRTQVIVAADGKVTVEDAAAASRGASLGEKLYPIHSAKVGGLAWKLAMTVSGLALALLGSLATWSFWARRGSKRKRRRVLALSSSAAA